MVACLSDTADGGATVGDATTRSKWFSGCRPLENVSLTALRSQKDALSRSAVCYLLSCSISADRVCQDGGRCVDRDVVASAIMNSTVVEKLQRHFVVR